MRYLTIADLKRFLYIDFEENDEALGDMIGAAEQLIQKRLNCNLEDLEDEYEQLPYPVLQAIKIMAGNLYANRESVSFNATPMKIPYSFEYLLQPYINYKRSECDTEGKECKKHRHHHKHHNSEETECSERKHGHHKKTDSDTEENNDDYGTYDGE